MSVLLTVYELYFLHVTVTVVTSNFNFKVTCPMFWPNEITKSMEFDHVKVNHDSTIPKTGYEMTRLDAFEKGKVGLR